MKSLFASLTFGVLVSLHTIARAETPDYAVVKDLQIDGSGCQAQSAQASITSDLGFLSVLYNNFSVEIGQGTANPGAKADEKNCTINVIVQIPPGWTFEFDSVEYNGFVALPNKATLAYQVITAEVYGGRGMAFDQNLMNGPKTKNFTALAKNRGKLGKIVNALGRLQNNGLATCSNQVQETKVKIKSIIGVRNLLASFTKPKVQILVDSTDAAFKQNLKLNWSRCQ